MNPRQRVRHAESLSAARLAAGFGAAIAIVIAAGVYVIARRNCVPDPLATHWGIDSRPNGYMSLRGFAFVSLTIPGAAVLAAIVVALFSGDGHVQRAALSAAGAAAAFFGLLTILTVEANVGGTTWADARSVGWPVAFAAMAVLLGGGAFGWRVAGRVSPIVRPVIATTSSIGLRPGEIAVWSGRASSRVMALTGIGDLLVAAILAVVAPAPIAFVLLAMAPILLLFAEITVTVDRRGLRVAFGPLRWPVRRLPLASIAQAEAIDVRPMQWGGWGYRWAPGRAATGVVLRAGPGLKVTLTDGRAFVVTVDDPDYAAGLLNDLVNQAVAERR